VLPPPVLPGNRLKDEYKRIVTAIGANGNYRYADREYMMKIANKFFNDPINEDVVEANREFLKEKAEDDILFVKEIRISKNIFESKTNPLLD
jgi:hypothetical protein